MARSGEANALCLAFQLVIAGRHSIVRGRTGVVSLAHEVRLDPAVTSKLLPLEQSERPQHRRFRRRLDATPA